MTRSYSKAKQEEYREVDRYQTDLLQYMHNGYPSLHYEHDEAYK